jgi:hypothetical protein
MSRISKQEQQETSMNFSCVEIYPKVVVYRGLLSDSDVLYETMKKSSDDSQGKFYLNSWDKWSVFGMYSSQKYTPFSPSEQNEQMHKDEKYLVDRLAEASSIATKDYIKRFGIELPYNSRLTNSSFCKYGRNLESIKNNLTMQYHTDYIICEKDTPGQKFFLTCTAYINDDYDGGDIIFYINGDSINHKPKAGDILVFPSYAPYYHGVKTIRNGDKFMVRNFIVYDYDGTEEWLENQKTYGALKWAEMEKKRVDVEMEKYMLYAVGDKVLSYDEYSVSKYSSSGKFGPRAK